MPRNRSSLLEAHAWPAVLVLLRTEKDDTRAFERTAHRLDIRLRAALWPPLAFHAPDCENGELGFLSEHRLAPIEQRPCSADLGSGKFHFRTHVRFWLTGRRRVLAFQSS